MSTPADTAKAYPGTAHCDDLRSRGDRFHLETLPLPLDTRPVPTDKRAQFVASLTPKLHPSNHQPTGSDPDNEREVPLPTLNRDAETTRPLRQRRGDFALHTRNFGWPDRQTETFEVEVLARSKGYAMVRRRGCTPFVVSEASLAQYVD
jgi:hypothetical protein